MFLKCHDVTFPVSHTPEFNIKVLRRMTSWHCKSTIYDDMHGCRPNPKLDLRLWRNLLVGMTNLKWWSQGNSAPQKSVVVNPAGVKLLKWRR